VEGAGSVQVAGRVNERLFSRGSGLAGGPGAAGRARTWFSLAALMGPAPALLCAAVRAHW